MQLRSSLSLICFLGLPWEGNRTPNRTEGLLTRRAVHSDHCWPLLSWRSYHLQIIMLYKNTCHRDLTQQWRMLHPWTMDESQMCSAKWKKPETKGSRPYGSCSVWYSRKSKTGRSGMTLGVPGSIGTQNSASCSPYIELSWLAKVCQEWHLSLLSTIGSPQSNK